MKKHFLALGMLTLCAGLVSPTWGFASDDCPDFQSPLVTTDATIKKAFEAHNAFYVVFDDGFEEKTVRVSYGDREIYQKFVGQNVEVKYWEVQYFDEHDGQCTESIEFDMIGDVEIPK